MISVSPRFTRILAALLCLAFAVAGCQKKQYPMAGVKDQKTEVNYTVEIDRNKPVNPQ